MKNIVIISATPRIGGNSELMAKQFKKGAEEAGHNVQMYNLREKNINYCIGCYACKTTGKCFRADGVNEIGEEMTKADVIVFATPVYFYSMSGQMKVFIDRLTPYYKDIHADIYMIASMHDTNPEMMNKTFDAIRGLTMDCCTGCTEKGVIVGHSLGRKGKVEYFSPELLDKAYQMGKNC